MGALSFSPSPITTTPAIEVVSSIRRIPSTAAWSAEILSPRPIQRPAPPARSPEIFPPPPTQRPADIAADSVTRTSSSARLRSGALAGTVETGLSTPSVTGGILLRVLAQEVEEERLH